MHALMGVLCSFKRFRVTTKMIEKREKKKTRRVLWKEEREAKGMK